MDFRAVDEKVVPGESIIDSIHTEIATADIGIAVISGFNTNVMYELGRLLGGSKPTILVADKESISNLPFDMKSFSIVGYDAKAKDATDLTNVIAKSLGKIKGAMRGEFLQAVATSKPLPENLSTLTSTITASEIQSLSAIDWGSVKDEGERMLGKSGCKSIDVEVVETDDFKGWRQTLDCPCGDTVIIIVDLNGDVKRAKVR